MSLQDTFQIKQISHKPEKLKEFGYVPNNRVDASNDSPTNDSIHLICDSMAKSPTSFQAAFYDGWHLVEVLTGTWSISSTVAFAEGGVLMLFDKVTVSCGNQFYQSEQFLNLFNRIRIQFVYETSDSDLAKLGIFKNNFENWSLNGCGDIAGITGETGTSGATYYNQGLNQRMQWLRQYSVTSSTDHPNDAPSYTLTASPSMLVHVRIPLPLLLPCFDDLDHFWEQLKVGYKFDIVLYKYYTNASHTIFRSLDSGIMLKATKHYQPRIYYTSPQLSPAEEAKVKAMLHSENGRQFSYYEHHLETVATANTSNTFTNQKITDSQPYVDKICIFGVQNGALGSATGTTSQIPILRLTDCNIEVDSANLWDKPKSHEELVEETERNMAHINEKTKSGKCIFDAIQMKKGHCYYLISVGEWIKDKSDPHKSHKIYMNAKRLCASDTTSMDMYCMFFLKRTCKVTAKGGEFVIEKIN